MWARRGAARHTKRLGDTMTCSDRYWFDHEARGKERPRWMGDPPGEERDEENDAPVACFVKQAKQAKQVSTIMVAHAILCDAGGAS